MGTPYDHVVSLLKQQKKQMKDLELDNNTKQALLNELKKLVPQRSEETTLVNQINEIIKEVNTHLAKQNKLAFVEIADEDELTKLFIPSHIDECKQRIEAAAVAIVNKKILMENDNNAYKSLLDLLESIKEIFGSFAEMTPASRPKFANLEDGINKAIDDSGLNTQAPLKTNMQFLKEQVAMSPLDSDSDLLAKIDARIDLIKNSVVPAKFGVIDDADNKVVELYDIKDKLLALYSKFIMVNDNPKLLNTKQNKDAIEKTIEKQKATITDLTAKNTEIKDCVAVLREIVATGLKPVDPAMQTFSDKYLNKLVSNQGNLEELKKIKDDLSKIRDSLNKSKEFETVLAVTTKLAAKNAFYTVGVEKKLDRIYTAIANLSVEERATVLSSKKNNEVKRALAVKRPVFFGGNEEAKTNDKGMIITEKAAATYQDAMKSLKVGM